MYTVYLLDGTDYVELECDEVDFTTVFSVAEIADISIRKDSITKNIVFKGTPKNNNAFGNMFHLNKRTDVNLANKLFFNYNPLVRVDCIILEDSVLILQGTMRVTEVTVDGKGNIFYSTVVTGNVVEFKSVIKEKYLTDLDFSDLKHAYTVANVMDSWSIRTQRTNTTSNTQHFVPFEKGSGYVYPYIDYGISSIYRGDTNPDVHRHIGNFKTAIYVKEYFDRIFNQEELEGFTYEVRGSEEFLEKFNSLIVPNNEGGLSQRNKDKNFRLYANTSQTHTNNLQHADGLKSFIYPINLPAGMTGTNSTRLVNYLGTYVGKISAVLGVERGFKSGGFASVTFATLVNGTVREYKMTLEVVLRKRQQIGTPEFEDVKTWDSVIASTSITVPAFTTRNNLTVSMDIGEAQFEVGEQLMLRLKFEDVAWFLQVNPIQYNITAAELRFPKDQVNETLTYDAAEGDMTTPSAPKNVKQVDFIKSIISLYNLYVYTEKTNPKHIIFQTYDDFYALDDLTVLDSTAADWTHKVDHNQGFKVLSNLTLPKNYLFTWKDDSADSMNTVYKTNFNEVYGQFKFTDNLGLADQKKVELIFSPSPLWEPSNTGRKFPMMYLFMQIGTANKNTNIRLLYYNGLKQSLNTWHIIKETLQIAGITVDPVSGRQIGYTTIASDLSTYPQCGNYYYQDGVNNFTPVEDLYFGRPIQSYFLTSKQIQDCPTAYEKYYINQVTEMTNPDVTFFECEAYLNEVDIANLDLRRPVFIDTGGYGHAYFRVLSVEYNHKNVTSRVKLQRLVF